LNGSGWQVARDGGDQPAPYPRFPDVATVSESGLTGLDFNSWFALMVPVGTLRRTDQAGGNHGRVTTGFFEKILQSYIGLVHI
jgi:hypothetical protein